MVRSKTNRSKTSFKKFGFRLKKAGRQKVRGRKVLSTGFSYKITGRKPIPAKIVKFLKEDRKVIVKRIK